MIGIIEALNRIYSGKDVVFKHVTIFTMIAIAIGMVLTSDIKHLGTSDTFTLVVVGAVFIYLSGYALSYIKDYFDDRNKNSLPEFDLSPLKLFLLGFVLNLCWSLYISALSFLVRSCLFISPMLTLVLAIVAFIYQILIAFAFPMMTVHFAKNGSLSGCLAPSAPFQYLKSTWLHISILSLKVLPLFVLFFLSIFFVASILPLFLNRLLIIVFIYAVYVLSLAYCYECAEIYQEKYLPTTDDYMMNQEQEEFL